MLKVIALFITVLMVAPALAAPQSTRLEIDTMTCGPDPHAIKSALQAVRGVDAVDVFLEQKSAIVTFDNEQTTVDALLAAVASTGHAGLPIQPKP